MCELVPVSSSSHLALVSAFLRWPYESADPELRKAFEVACHGAAAAALVLVRRDEVRRELRHLNVRRTAELCLTVAPAACVAVACRRPLIHRFGTVSALAVAQMVSGALLAAADLRPEHRTQSELGPSDYAALGIAQALALAPGVSRSGATLTAARLLGLNRSAARRVSEQIALPIIAAAAAFKGFGVLRRSLPPETHPAFAAGGCLAFCGALCAQRTGGLAERRRAYLALGCYRLALGTVSLVTARRASRRQVARTR